MHYAYRVLLVLFCFSFATAHSQTNGWYQPSFFIKDTTMAFQYTTAYLVSDRDTLISWNKKGNQTIVTYLNTKITETVWTDSVEVCIQEGFLLEDFQESCEVKSIAGTLRSRTYKNVNEFRYSKITSGVEHFYVKSYSEGLRYRGKKIANGSIEVSTRSSKTLHDIDLDSLFKVTIRLRKKEDTPNEILVFLTDENKIKTISNPSEFNTFKIIKGLNTIMHSSKTSQLFFRNEKKSVGMNSKYLVMKTTFSLDFE